tara:strand:- start:341 stop:664 length:324 start_codon:yes stop_codon:yes gene_type:complete
MIKLTKNAGEKLRSIFENQEKKPIGIRAGVKGGGCSGFSYYLDYVFEKDEKDREILSEEVKIFIDPKSFLYLMGTEIDYLDGLAGKGFKFLNPNARRTCGCGESFSV